MTDEHLPAQVFPNRFPEAVDSRPGVPQDRCHCFGQGRVSPPGAATSFHTEIQDTGAPGWLRLLELIEEAVADGREEFRPLPELSPEERRQIVTLPASIGRLTAVRTLVLYGSNLVRVPPEIGDMTNLEEFSPYTSRRLHWFPYEITRCGRLVNSTVSTRSIYGNYKYRPPFRGSSRPAIRSRTSTAWLPPAGAPPRLAPAVSALGPSLRRARTRHGSPRWWRPMSCRSWSMPARRSVSTLCHPGRRATSLHLIGAARSNSPVALTVAPRHGPVCLPPALGP